MKIHRQVPYGQNLVLCMYYLQNNLLKTIYCYLHHKKDAHFSNPNRQHLFLQVFFLIHIMRQRIYIYNNHLYYKFYLGVQSHGIMVQ